MAQVVPVGLPPLHERVTACENTLGTPNASAGLIERVKTVEQSVLGREGSGALPDRVKACEDALGLKPGFAPAGAPPAGEVMNRATSHTLQSIAGTWVPTRLDDWRGCPVGKEARVTTYKYVVQGNGDWVDELYPSHRGHVEPAEESGLYEGYGVEPGRYPAKWRLQPNGVLVAAWGDQFNVVYYLVREGDPRTATTGGAAHLNHELNHIARNTDDTHRARDLVDQGADLSSTNGAPWHHTPLHQASYHGRYAMAETLVGLGAPLHLHSNPCGRGRHGTPLELARGGGHHAIAEMLTCNGGAEPVVVTQPGAAGNLSAQATRGCYVGACCIPIILTCFHITPVGEDELEDCGCTLCFGIPCPWSGRIQRAGPRRWAGRPNAADPNNYQIWDFDPTGSCFCGKDGNESPLWCACRVCPG